MSPAAKAAARGKPVWKQVEEEEARSLRGRARRASSGAARRYTVIHEIDGPHVRLGVVWFVAASVALAAGPLSTAVVYGAVASVSAAQAARAWGRRGMRTSQPMAAGGAVCIALGAVLGAGGMGLGLIAAAALAYVAAAGERRSKNPLIANAGMTLQCGAPPGVVAGSMVLLLQVDIGAAFALLLLASAFEIGDYLIGSAATNPVEGPLAGIAAMFVVGFIVSAFPITSLDVAEAMAFSGATMLLAPAGQLLASAVLPTATARASALRRLDSLLLAAPLWAWGVGVLG